MLAGAGSKGLLSQPILWMWFCWISDVGGCWRWAERYCAGRYWWRRMWLCRACERMLPVGVEATSSIPGAAGAVSISDVSIATLILDAIGMASILGWAGLHQFLGVAAAASIPGAVADASNLVKAIATSTRVWQRLHQFRARKRMHQYPGDAVAALG